MGWFLIFILIPILMPMMLVAIYGLAPVQQETGLKLIQQVKDGQLSWPACGFCASALYELADTSVPIDKLLANWTQATLTVLLLISAFIALLSVVFPTPLPANLGRQALSGFRLMLGSVVMVAATAVAYTWLHFMVST